MKLLITLTLIPLLWISAALAGQDMYTSEQLANDKARYAQRIQQLFRSGLWDYMTPEEKRALQGVVIRHPLRGAGPLTFQSLVFEGRPMVRAPIMSLKFIEDLSVAYAWRYLHGYSLEQIDVYLTVLKHRPDQVFKDGRASDPITALGIPPRIWEREAKVDNLSLKFRNSAWTFILAHELGHLRFGHSQPATSPAEIQRREEKVDEFAVDLLARDKEIPIGMILWLQATAGYMKNRSDFPTDAAYVEWVRDHATHPVNGRRVRSLAAAMNRQAVAGRNPDQAADLQFVTEGLTIIGETIEDPDMQRLLRRCAAGRDAKDLKQLAGGSCF